MMPRGLPRRVLGRWPVLSVSPGTMPSPGIVFASLGATEGSLLGAVDGAVEGGVVTVGAWVGVVVAAGLVDGVVGSILSRQALSPRQAAMASTISNVFRIENPPLFF